MNEVPQTLTVCGLSARYGEIVAISDVDLAIAPGTTLAIVGPSGAGKSTLLRTIAGLHPAAHGTVRVGERRIETSTPQERRVAMVFATDGLVRHARVRENLRVAARSRERLDERITQLARTFEIERHLDRRPGDLSTGERARVALVRALLSDPDVLLLDEPLAAVDPQLRGRIREELVHVRETFSGPMLIVTHDHTEAMAVGDDLAVLIDGRIVDRGEPQRVYDAPASAQVGTFLGARPMNVFSGALIGLDASVLAGIRPERLRLVQGGMLRGNVARIERTGADTYVHVACEGATLLARVDAAQTPERGAAVALGFDAADVRRFDGTSGAALP